MFTCVLLFGCKYTENPIRVKGSHRIFSIFVKNIFHITCNSLIVSGGRASNPLPEAWKASALPNELPPHCVGYWLGANALIDGEEKTMEGDAIEAPPFRRDPSLFQAVSFRRCKYTEIFLNRKGKRKNIFHDRSGTCLRDITPMGL